MLEFGTQKIYAALQQHDGTVFAAFRDCIELGGVMPFVSAACLYRYSSVTTAFKFTLIFKVDGDGDCMFAVILKQIEFQEEIQKFIFTPLYLRRMLAVQYMKYKDENNKELFYAVRKSLFVYGLPQEDTETVSPGPFRIKEYFENIIQAKHGEM